MPACSDSGKNEKKGDRPLFLLLFLLMTLKVKVSLRAKPGNLLEKKRAFFFPPNRRNKLKEFMK
jgi:hypothetical protein